jgi:hypothetical protein
MALRVSAMAVCYRLTVVWLRDAMLIPLTFCTGRLVFDLAFDNVIHVAVVSHPSLLKPEDLDVRYP